MLDPAETPGAPNPPLLSVVIPLYNEEDNVQPMIDELHRALEGINHELVLVDDGSTDATASNVPADDATIQFLQFENNTGQSAAMYAGVHAATGEIIGITLA